MPVQKYQFIYNEEKGKYEPYKPYKTVKIDCDTEKEYNALTDLLKRDEPKKVEITMALSDKTKIKYIDCPNCYEHFAGLDYYCSNGSKWSFCPNCGQALDWSDKVVCD